MTRPATACPRGRLPIVIALGCAVALAACGTATKVATSSSSTTSATAGPTTTTSPPSTASGACQGSQLSASMSKPLQEGGGHGTFYYILTNSSSEPCYVQVGLPQVAAVNRSGQVVARDVLRRNGQLSGGGGTLTVEPGKSVYFLIISYSGCTINGYATGGPFSVTITLPGGTVVKTAGFPLASWSDFCTQQPIAEGVLQSTPPAKPPND